jgi:hypothetical protein
MRAKLLAAWHLERYQLWVSWSDGLEGTIDLEDQLSPWSLEPIRDLAEFRRVRLDRAQNLLVWPAGVELDPAALHRELARRRARPRVGYRHRTLRT